MTDHPRQKVSIIPLKRSHFAIQLESSALGSDLSLSAPIIPVTPGQSWNMSGLFEKHTNFSGSIAMAVILTGKNEKGTYTNQNFAIKEPFLVRADGWMKVRQAFTIPAGGKTIQVQIRGRFHGTIRLKNPTLEFCPVPAP
jgi:hypothetical protein